LIGRRHNSYLRQTLSFAMQELPHGLPLTQFGVFVSAVLPLRHELGPLPPKLAEMLDF
jgi:hypothetical protein